jgi:hypothetical protein
MIKRFLVSIGLALTIIFGVTALYKDVPPYYSYLGMVGLICVGLWFLINYKEKKKE